VVALEDNIVGCQSKGAKVSELIKKESGETGLYKGGTHQGFAGHDENPFSPRIGIETGNRKT